eukprot:gene695-752_t
MDEFYDVVLKRNNPFNVQTLFTRNLLARVAVYYCFMLEGQLAGVWGRYMPEIQDHIGLSDSLLGTSVTFFYLGNVLSAFLDAYLVKKYGSRVITSLGAWIFIGCMPLVALADNFGVLSVATLAFGLGCGIMDISMNNSAILTEIVANIPLLGSFHGSYSISAALGSLLGGLLIQGGLSTFHGFALCSGVGIVLSLSTFYNMYDYDQEVFLTSFHRNHDDSEERERKGEFDYDGGVDNPLAKGLSDGSSPLLASDQLDYDTDATNRTESSDESESKTNDSLRILSVFAACGFFAAFGESSVVTWSTVYFDREIHANSVVKSLGLTCFMICMGCGRFACDYLRRVIGRRLMVRIGGFLAMLGLIIAVVSVSTPCPPVFACMGFACSGLGLSTIIPTVFSSAGHLPGVHGGTSVAVVAAFTYMGSICSSPLVGLLSDSFGSLRLALLCDGLFLGLMMLLSFGVIPEQMVFNKVMYKQLSVDDDSSSTP